MFRSRDTLRAGTTSVEVAFTDRHGGISTSPFETLDLSRSRPGRDDEIATNLALVAHAFGVDGFATMRQVHGQHVEVVHSPGPVPTGCDALVTTTPDVALCVRVGDCVPVVLADVSRGVVGVCHAGRRGLVEGVVPAAAESMRAQGAGIIEAWVGPYVCGGCYELPSAMRDEVARVVPTAYACTTWGTPSVDIGAGVRAQLEFGGCIVHDRSTCTLESDDLYSYRRDGDRSGRFAGLVVLRRSCDE
ncbi:MAG: laccase domain-containing protein [Propionibacteriales bacterium]|nr:laccase domain-containing protein [Propionibacteriales bacterium]